MNIEDNHEQSESEESGKNIFIQSMLNFVDLAGSERISPLMTKADPKDREKEGKYINKSLFFLTQVISQLAEGKLDHIAYRNSPLTKILRSSIGGNARTAIILCVNPAYSQYEQTLSTLRFGLSAKNIENNLEANVKKSENNEALEGIINDYERRLKEMEEKQNTEKNNSENLLKVITDLQKQKGMLLNRLMESNQQKLRVTMAKPIHSFNLYSRPMLYMKEVGLLLTTAKVDYVRDHSKCLKKAFLHFDSNGKFALQALQISKKEKELLENKIVLLTDCLDSTTRKFNDQLKIEDKNSSTIKDLKYKLAKETEEKLKLASYIKKLSERMFLLESCQGIGKEKDFELDKLERGFNENINKIKNERIKRQTQDRINKLKKRINSLQKYNMKLTRKELFPVSDDSSKKFTTERHFQHNKNTSDPPVDIDDEEEPRSRSLSSNKKDNSNSAKTVYPLENTNDYTKISEIVNKSMVKDVPEEGSNHSKKQSLKNSMENSKNKEQENPLLEFLSPNSKEKVNSINSNLKAVKDEITNKEQHINKQNRLSIGSANERSLSVESKSHSSGSPLRSEVTYIPQANVDSKNKGYIENKFTIDNNFVNKYMKSKKCFEFGLNECEEDIRVSEATPNSLPYLKNTQSPEQGTNKKEIKETKEMSRTGNIKAVQVMKKEQINESPIYPKLDLSLNIESSTRNGNDDKSKLRNYLLTSTLRKFKKKEESKKDVKQPKTSMTVFDKKNISSYTERAVKKTAFKRDKTPTFEGLKQKKY